MIYGMCFDGSVVRGCGDEGLLLNFSNTHATGHVRQMETNYSRARQMGLTCFRDTVLWDEPNESPDYHWLDRLQAVSNNQIELALNHYGLPEWISEAMFWSNGAAEVMYELAYQIGRRYAGAFRSYNLGVELGIWTDWVAAPNNRQWPFGNQDWWTVYRQTSAITIAIAKGLKAADPTCLTAMSEPWGWGPMPYPDQARPFATILGRQDDVARHYNCTTWQQGDNSLLDIVGLNIYFDNGIPQMLTAARQLFPDKKVVVAETANVYYPDCNPPARWWGKFEALNEPDLEVCWSPGLTMLTHERGERMGGSLLSEDGTQYWQKP